MILSTLCYIEKDNKYLIGVKIDFGHESVEML